MKRMQDEVVSELYVFCYTVKVIDESFTIKCIPFDEGTCYALMACLDELHYQPDVR